MRGAKAEMEGFSVGPCKSDTRFATGSSGGTRMFLFNMLPLGGGVAPCDDEEEAFGGGGNGGGSFPWRLLFSVLSVSLSSPAISPSIVCDGSLDLNLTSERNSRSSLERANELRGEEDDARGRENR